VLILRIRQAQCALADGRLDEAFEIAQRDQIQRHRHGQKLVGRLARALVQRGQENLAAHRFQSALADCNKAEKLAGTLPEVAQLRAAVCDAIVKEQQVQQHGALRVAQARQQIDNGWLSVGGQILDEAPAGDMRAEMVRQELAAARLKTEDAVSKAERALANGEIEEAMDIARSSVIGQSRNGQAGEILRRIRSRALECIRADLNQGRIDRAQSLLQRLMPLGKDGADVVELRDALGWCRQAAQHVAAGTPSLALPLLRKIKTVCPTATWVDSAIADIKRAAEAYEELGAGPLGLASTDGSAVRSVPIRALEETPRGVTTNVLDDATRRNAESGDMPTRFVMQIDGVGSFVVFRDSRITVGPISSSTRPALGLIADPNLPTVCLERVEGDYFIRSATPIDVNGQAVMEKLLSDGDRIALSPRCRIRFALPNPASTTAVLSVSGARLSRPDVRQIILMDRDILIGPYANNHVRTEQVREPMALFVQNGRLLCRTKDDILVDGASFDPGVGLAVDKPVRIGGLSMVVARLGDESGTH
jgi:tetratricopeptide (TPR) repeat protein